MKKHRKNKQSLSDKRKRQLSAFLQKYGMIIFALISGLVLGKFILPMVMR